MRISEKARGTIFQAERPLLYYVTDRRQLSGETVLSRIRRVLARGVDFIQIREKDLSDRDLFALTQSVVSLARGKRCRILVNGRADVALAAGAHGVHLPTRSLPIGCVRRWLPPSFLIGVSAHSQSEARLAARAGTDYLLLGPVFPTATKLEYGPPLGLTCLRETCRKVPIPVFGLGGIRPQSVDTVTLMGAVGVAGITLFQKDLFLLPTKKEKNIRTAADLLLWRPRS